MFITKRIIGFPIVAFFLSFLTELLANYVSFLNLNLLKYFFRVRGAKSDKLSRFEQVSEIHSK